MNMAHLGHLFNLAQVSVIPNLGMQVGKNLCKTLGVQHYWNSINRDWFAWKQAYSTAIIVGIGSYVHLMRMNMRSWWCRFIGIGLCDMCVCYDSGVNREDIQTRIGRLMENSKKWQLSGKFLQSHEWLSVIWPAATQILSQSGTQRWRNSLL